MADPRVPSIAVLVREEPDGVPLYTQLYRQLRAHILDGTLAPGSPIPSARTLASDLRVSRNTVEAAVTQLRAEGFLMRRVGAGTVVADMRDAAPFARRPSTVRALPRSRPSHQSTTQRPPRLSTTAARLVARGETEITWDVRTGPSTVDVARFPSQTWHRILAREARRGGAASLSSGDPRGHVPLRAAIAEHTRLTRGLSCTGEQVLITSSTQQALDLTARLLVSRDDVVLMEEPGYLAARAVFEATGARVRGIPVDASGIAVDHLPKHGAACLLYLTPSHQYPLGVVLAISRRLAALQWAAQSKAWIVEDDYDGEFQYSGRPIAALQGLDRDERVVYVGTFNKVLFPGLRLGYVVLPAALVDAFTAARRIADGGPPTLPQAALARFMSEGHFAAHLRRARKSCAERRDILVSGLTALDISGFHLGPSDTGTHLVVHLPAHVDDEAVAIAAAGNGLGVSPLSRYYTERAPRRGLLINFGVSESDIRIGVAALAELLAASMKKRRRAT